MQLDSPSNNFVSTDLLANSSRPISHQRFIKYVNLTLYILRKEPSVVLAANTLYLAFTCIGFLSNTLLLLVILRSRKELLRLPSNILLLNLAIANLAYLITNLAFKFYSWTLPIDHASSNLVMQAASTSTSSQLVLSNCILSVLIIFNFWSIHSPINFKVYVTRKKTWNITTLIWIISVGLSLPSILIPLPRGIFAADGHLSEEYFTTKTINHIMIYGFILDTLSVFPAATLILCLYPVMLFKLCKGKYRTERSKEFRREITIAIKRVSNIFIVFVLYCSFQFTVTLTVYYVMLSDFLDVLPLSPKSYDTLKFLTVVFIPFKLFSATLNPIIHALSTDNYRKYYLPPLCSLRRRLPQAFSASFTSARKIYVGSRTWQS